ncbi:ATP phosphoribosyltransferase regulatory subunit [Pectobacterium brasiliense]|uniref:BREX-1 system adenine-specific DNA-methyltransferase PglX n=1 Tax=Pectobacterium TaxID=122277 RepID=UPI00201B3C49|nr:MULTISPECIES: BREX-1 system adenine-specific DNA-methyltransferase PglX [Pectobacterium]MCL6328381.1 ATP phosphoribosyltransferase regulatory subunit [Pectobacterium carotovorum subsp. carotovorum]MCL6377750.1 ATP phosphoribosyltransferase regulatory subunit [Pectobacterium brasiliense]
MSLTNLHAEWLSLTDISGPFLAIPVLMEAFPQGLEELNGTKRKRVRQAYDEWREALEQEDPQLIELHYAWLDEVLSQVLDLDEDGKSDVLKRVEWCANHLESVLPDHGVVQSPDLAVVDEQRANKPLMLIHTYTPDVDLEATIKRDGWLTTPADRMVQLCRSLDCRLGLVTNGERWMLVDAPVGAVTSFASWYARLWNQEPITLQAFVHLLGIRRFFVNESEQLPALFDCSLKYQDEVTDALGEQVRRAVEVLIQSLDKADQDRNRELLHNVKEAELYEAALTVMMRLVFLLSAEERGLLLLGDERYETNYAISTLRMQLRKESSEILERRWDAWSRLLAIFRAVYCGVEHENLRLPALGSSLFDPDHFPFLEGRAKGSNWRTDTAKPLPIDNRTVLLLLEAIQQFQGRTLSYRALDVEQIGYVYEGLLERTVMRIGEVTLELDATKKAQSPWVKLAELDSANMDGIECLVKLLQERSGSSVSRVRKDLTKTVDDTLVDRLLTTCQGDIQLRDRIKPYVHLLRTDPWGYPLVYPAGAFIVTTGSNRRETGTHYTPKSLTETIVAETLTPLAYVGPAEGTPRKEWQLKSPKELLDLKICDPAMGSGAFLVQVCRWLADRLIDAWSLTEESGKAVSVDGNILEITDSKELLPRDTDARIIIARRLIAERCLYGVDLNPLAVELAKLSIWLVTLAKDRPFGFLDHSLRCGDSLLGIHRLAQLTQLSMNPIDQYQLHLFGQNIERVVHEVIELRQQLREMPIQDIHDVEAMAHLNKDAHQWLEVPKNIADAFIGEVFETSGNAAEMEKMLASLATQAGQAIEGECDQIALMQQRSVTSLSANLSSNKPAHKPFHWPLEFPEVFTRENGGFDGIVGNPPFLGGQRITGVVGTKFRDWLVTHIAEGRRGSADLSAYFFLRALSLLRKGGNFGLLAVNTIAEGDTRQVGLEAMVGSGAVIYSAYPNEPWPGKAAVITSRVHVHNGKWQGERTLLGRSAPFISAFLSDREEWSPERLKENGGLAYQGSIVLGMGFVLFPEQAQSMIDADPKNAEVIFPYINGDDLNSNPDQKPSRWVINFWDWPEERAREYKLPWKWIEERVKPERQRQNERGEFVLRKPLPERWWHYAEKRPALYHAIGRGCHFNLHPKGWTYDSCQKESVFCLSRVSKYLAPAMTPSNYMWSDSMVIFRSDSFAFLGILFSQIHEVWVRKNSSRLESRLRYTPSDALETLPFPSISLEKLGAIAKEFADGRAAVCLEKKMGVTEIYNLLHTYCEQSSSIERLRTLQREIDIEVANAYGWDDLNLEHGFHEVPYLPENDRIRFTISEAARGEVLQRLSELNRLRYQEELAAGLHEKTTKPKILRTPQR